MKRFFGRERNMDPSADRIEGKTLFRKIELSSVIDVAVEVWRLQDRFKKLESASGREDPSIAFAIEKIQHILKEIGIEARGYTGQTYNEGMSLDVLAFDYPVEQKPANRVVQETVSPAIFFDGTLQKMAQVIVGKGDSTADDKNHD